MRREEMTSFWRSWPWWRWALTGLSALALALCAYLSWHYLAGASVIGCGAGSACDEALSSRWSTVGGVLPVSGLAGGTYMAMLLASLFIGPRMPAPVRRLAWRVMLILVGAAAGSAVWFFIVGKWLLGAFCPYCMAAHITGLLLVALVIWRAPLQLNNATAAMGDVTASPAAARRLLGRLPVVGQPLAGMTLAGILAACQVAFPPPAAYVSGESQNNLPAMDTRAVPIVGSPEASCVVSLLFDYTCPHCQQMHFMLGEVIRRYKGKLAFALCPAPLDSECNPYITRDVEEFKDSCELVKLGLAVWLAQREALPAFEDWMFSFESGDRWRPRKLDAARAKAVELIGQARFDAAWADPWIDQYVQTSIRIYGQTIQSGRGGVPKLVFGSRWVIPEPYDADDLVSILCDSLGVPSPGLGLSPDGAGLKQRKVILAPGVSLSGGWRRHEERLSSMARVNL